MTQTIIELGVLGEPDERSSSAPALPAGMLRTLLASALALACLLTLGASAVGTPGLGEPLWTGAVNLTGFTLGDHLLYSYGPDGKVLIARDLLTGEQRWTRDLIGLPVLTEDLGSGTTLVATRELDNSNDADRRFFGNMITLLRTDTGEQLAQTVGDYARFGDVLLVLSDDSQSRPDCRDASCFVVTGWDIATGRQRWNRRLAQGAVPVFTLADDRATVFGELSDDGTFQLRETATGAATGTLALPRDLRTHDGAVWLLRDTLLTMQPGTDGPIFTAYRVPTLRRAWTITLPAAPPDPNTDPTSDLRFGVYATDCGRDACVQLGETTATLIQASTGAVSAPITLQLQLRIGDGVLLATAFSGRNVRIDPAGIDPVAGYVLDPSGRTIGQFWFTARVEWDATDGVLLALGSKIRTGFTVIDEQGGQRYLGSVTGTHLSCDAHGEYLACADPGDHLRLWHLPPPARSN